MKLTLILSAAVLAVSMQPANAADKLRIATEGAYAPWNFSGPNGALDASDVKVGGAASSPALTTLANGDFALAFVSTEEDPLGDVHVGRIAQRHGVDEFAVVGIGHVDGVRLVLPLPGQKHFHRSTPFPDR